MMQRAIVLALTFVVCGPAVAIAAAQSAASQAPARPPGWSEAVSASLDLAVAGKHSELIALFEPWVAKYPRFPDAHVMLGGAHEMRGRAELASRTADAAERSRPHFERAVEHLRHALALPGGADIGTMTSLIDLYSELGLNRRDEYERLVHEAVTRFPAEPRAHAYLIALLADNDVAIDGALRDARAALPNNPDARASLATTLYQFTLFPLQANAEALLRAALELSNEALTMKPDHEEARLFKRMIEEEIRKRERKPGARRD